ncbi:undecaprenyldiphospho-muramoylpentapeptide beta-N-acetylglucosaminyltransferase [Desulfobulbus alkaliphilus]|uniref:undecaprenyldiphospho-muramoylpentapeptide beta-N-acetylglucosaminyltransferase n=1 Tax=Desulfobulbus alkaliphilus TaxID=869814 RepID=UPI0019623ABB|nr:undecaprenyldiphospho-muramoylpentapeptide beta-N-acetylglucosaminyltransferase [Desulfobulbus alkaliphilus]MBM9536028.1 undecaprenyldiphospho-muramoylpentapeptide beta-N-acetylglucosaminyltransferase [Desulfobulbus alkaliphilus]
MRLIVAGGGTGGHLFPGIAVAMALMQRIADARVLFVGTSRLLDQRTLTDRGFELAALACGGLKGMSLGARVQSFLQIPGAVLAARRLLRDFRPDLVFSVGGYVTGPVVLAARTLGIPICLHEQNSVPGMANRWAARLADRICISLPCTPSFPVRKTVQTGNPVRHEILLAGEQGVQVENRPTLLVLGGSQGAHRVNMLMMEAMETLARETESLRVIHQTGTADEEMVAQCYQSLGVEAEVVSFIQDMAGVYAKASLAVSRAGATTLAELAVMGVPALLIPYPYAADNHQATNAAYYAQGGGGLVLTESGLTGGILARSISRHLQNQEELHTMAANMKAMAVPDASERIVDECLALVHRRGRSISS